MEKLIELLKQIQELAGVGVDALQEATKGGKPGGEGKPEGGPPEGGAPHEGGPPEGGKPPEGGPPPEGGKPPEEEGGGRRPPFGR